MQSFTTSGSSKCYRANSQLPVVIQASATSQHSYYHQACVQMPVPIAANATGLRFNCYQPCEQVQQGILTHAISQVCDHNLAWCQTLLAMWSIATWCNTKHDTTGGVLFIMTFDYRHQNIFLVIKNCVQTC